MKRGLPIPASGIVVCGFSPPPQVDSSNHSSTPGSPIPVQTATFLWNEFRKAGMMDIRCAYVHGAGGRIIAVPSLKQRYYLGHAKQVASLAGVLLQGGASTVRYIITVDGDVDPS